MWGRRGGGVGWRERGDILDTSGAGRGGRIGRASPVLLALLVLAVCSFSGAPEKKQRNGLFFRG